MYSETSIVDTLAVVPIVVNAGAALFPAIIAAIASVAAVIFKPKELFRICKTKPWIPLLIVLLGCKGFKTFLMKLQKNFLRLSMFLFHLVVAD